MPRRAVPPSPAAVVAPGRAVVSFARAVWTRVEALQELLEHDGSASAEKHAKFFRDKVVPAMASLRESGDAIECIAPQDVWPLPTYREMLFVR